MSFYDPNNGDHGFGLALTFLLLVILFFIIALGLLGCASVHPKIQKVYSGHFKEHLGQPYVLVHGAVAGPNHHIKWFPGISAMNAIEAAGGPKDEADTAHVLVIRGMGTEMQQTLRLDYGAVSRGKEPDPVLLPGDVIFFDTAFLHKLGQPLRLLFGAGQGVVK